MLYPKIDGYTIIQEIGSGGFSTVFLAQQGGKKYAAKRIPKIYKHSNRDFIEREIRVMQQSNHPNIAYIKDLRSDQNNIYIIEEFVQNSLFNIIEDKKKTYMEFTARPIIYQVLQALSYLHSIGFCHRDIKPQNILINNDGIVKLIDFGLSTAINARNVRCGSKNFFPPEVMESKSNNRNNQTNQTIDKISNSFNSLERYEQIKSISNIDIDGSKCDSWSCGVTFYIMLTGKFPWEKMTFNQITSEKIKYPPYLSKDCIDFLDKLLTIDPTKRITVEDAMNHKWLLKTLNIAKKLDLKSNDRLSSEKIDRFLSEFNLFPENIRKVECISNNFQLHHDENHNQIQNYNNLNQKSDYPKSILTITKEKNTESHESLFSSSLTIDDLNLSSDTSISISKTTNNANDNNTNCPSNPSTRRCRYYSYLENNSNKKQQASISSFDKFSFFNSSSHEENQRALNTQVENIFQKINAMKKTKK